MIFKLSKYGITESLLKFFQTYFTNRKQYVKINNYKSLEIKVESGAPQGSHLAALFYILYINDIKKCIKHSNFKLYIDDLKIYKEIKTENDHLLLQEDINRVERWNEENGLEFNPFKCRLIIFSRTSNFFNFNFQINNVNIERVQNIKDLGIIFDSKLEFNDHIEYISNATKKSLWMIKNLTKNFKKITSYKIVYNSFIKSKLMYGSVIWTPTEKGLIYKLEKIQHQFFRILSNKLNRPIPLYQTLIVMKQENSKYVL